VLVVATGAPLQGVVAFDGTCRCGSRASEQGQDAIDRVRARAAANRLVLGQRQVDAKSYAITAIPALRNLLDVRGGVVTSEASGCPTAMADALTAQQADYVLARKGNQERLDSDV
jgi:hypothetical protein